MNVPLAHVQGGEVTGSIDEKVRHAETKLADLHLVASRPAAERVIRMGERPECVFVTGCPSIDVAREAIAQGPIGPELFDRYGGVGSRIDLAKGYLVVLQHPVTTEYRLARRHAEETLAAIDALGLPAFWFWPNVDAGSDGTSGAIRAYREHHELPHVHFFKNLSPDDFVRLLDGCMAIVGNSSVAIRECGWLGVPAVNIGTRQSDRDRAANVIDVDFERRSRHRAAPDRLAAPARDALWRRFAGSASPQTLAEAPLSIGGAY